MLQVKKIMMVLVILGLSQQNVQAFGWDSKGQAQMYNVMLTTAATAGLVGTGLIGSAIYKGVCNGFNGRNIALGVGGVISIAAAIGLVKIAIPDRVFNP